MLFLDIFLSPFAYKRGRLFGNVGIQAALLLSGLSGDTHLIDATRHERMRRPLGSGIDQRAASCRP